MNLADLANYVCQKCQLVETSDVTAAKLFLSKRYELIYNSYLWKDSLVPADVAFDPVNNLDNASGIIVLPQMIDRLVAIRTRNNSVRIKGLEHFYRIDWNKFCQQQGTMFAPTEMSLLSPIWLTIRSAGQNLIPPGTTFFATPSQNGVPISGFVNGRTYTYVAGNEIGVGLTPVASGQPDPTYLTPGTFVATQDTYYLVGVNGVLATTELLTPGDLTTPITDQIQIVSTDATDTGKTVKLVWRDSKDRYVTESTLPITLNPAGGTTFVEIESLFKPVTTGTINVMLGSNIVLATLGPALLQSPSYQRVRAFPIPTQAMTLNVLGKKPFIPLTQDSEVPALRNLDNCLIALAVGDMFTRARFPAEEAQPHYQEGAVLLQELAKLETVQAANNSQFIPESGYGDAYFTATNSSGGGFWDY